jgi:hypothetical protein
MLKNILYFLLLIILASGVYFFIIRSSDSPFSAKEANFTVIDTAAIGKIFLAKNNGETVSLERTANGWTLNKQYPALSAPVKGLLITLKLQEVKAPVPSNAHNNIIKQIAGEGVKVEIYDRADKKMRVFYVGGEAPNNETYMLTEGAQTAYTVKILGFNGYLTPRYSTDWRDWRDRTVFNLAPEQIKKVSLTYTEEPLNSFTVKQEGSNLQVDYDPRLVGNKVLNQKRAKDYLGFFKNINCEGYTNGLIDVDTILKNTTKRCAMDMLTTDGKEQHVDIYWMPLNQRSKNRLTPMAGHPNQYDADRFYAVMNNNKDTIIIQRYTFDKLFRRAIEFYTGE